MEYRPYYLGREWCRLGHRVRIIASAHSHVRTHNPDLREKSRVDEVIDAVEYTWFKTPTYTGNGARRFLNIAAFVSRLYRDGPGLVSEYRPDVVIASSTYPLDIWPAHRIARLSGARLLFEVHDLWPLSPMELGGYSSRHPFIMLLQAAENYACRHADAVISILPNVREHLEAHGMAPHKLHLIPNGTDPAEWLNDPAPLPTSVANTLTELRQRDHFIVGFAGSHGVANALETLLGAAALMRDDPVAFVLVGAGPEKERLRQRARDDRLDNVCFLDPVAKQQIPALLNAFDLTYIGLQRQPLFRFGVAPNKLIDYMMAARPVLYAIEACNDLVAEAGCGISVKAENAPAVVQGIRAMRAMPPEQRSAMGRRGRDFVLENLIYPVLGQRFLKACC